MDFGFRISKIEVWIRNEHLQNTCVSISSQNGQLLIFRPKFGEIASYVQYFGSNIVEGVSES